MKGIYIHLFFHFTDSKIQVVNVVKNNGNYSIHPHKERTYLWLKQANILNVKSGSDYRMAILTEHWSW